MLYFHSTEISLLIHVYCVLCVLYRKGAEIINYRCLLWYVRAWEKSTLSCAPGNEAFCLSVGEIRERCDEGLKANRRSRIHFE